MSNIIIYILVPSLFVLFVTVYDNSEAYTMWKVKLVFRFLELRDLLWVFTVLQFSEL